MDKKQLLRLVDSQNGVISKIAFCKPLSEVLLSICQHLETIFADSQTHVSIVLLKDNKLHNAVSPSLTNEYLQLCEGIDVGPESGSCGTAMYTKRQVVVEDISESPLWQAYLPLIKQFNFQSCWSFPIISSQNEVLGSFAIYNEQKGGPSDRHLHLSEYCVGLARIAIEHHQFDRENSRLVEQLRHSNEKFDAFTSVMPDLALIIDEDGLYVDIFGADEKLLYSPEKELIGKNVQDILPEKDAKPIMEVINSTLERNQVQIFEYELDVPKGKVVFEGRTAPINLYDTDNPTKRHILWMARDITERKNSEREIQQLAFYDPLTSLPNRRLLIDRLKLLIDHVKRTKEVGSLLYLDLDNFKRINDSLGHSVGDRLLIEVSARLAPLLRQSDTFARLGGDEFVIMLESLKQTEDQACEEASIVAKKLIEAFDLPVSVDNSEYKIGASIGISLIEHNAHSPDEILMHADTAMYRSKDSGGNHFSFFDPNLQEIIDNRLKIENDILNAISNGQFCAFFQPQVNLNNRVTGAEALIRWVHPERGIVPPVHFVPVAEQFGLIHKLQQVVLDDVCKMLQQLLEQDLVDHTFCLSINISSSQFKSSNLEKDLLETISKFQLPVKQIKLEITESMLIHNIEDTIAQMERLKRHGFAFSIDDFGTGYSSLTYLHTFPIDELKIDKSFVDKMLIDDKGMSIVDTIVTLAKNLNFEVVVEGIEEEQQVHAFKTREIDSMQGYLFGKPMAADDFIQWLRQFNS